MNTQLTVNQYIESLNVLASRYSDRGDLPFEIELFIDEEIEILSAFDPADMLPFQ